MNDTRMTASGSSSAQTYPGSPQSPHTRPKRVNRARVTRACDRCERQDVQACTLADSVKSHRQPEEQGFTAQSQNAQQHEDSVFATSAGGLNPERPIPPLQQGTSTLVADSSNIFGGTTTSSSNVPTALPTEPVSRASPEPVQTDLEGHYVGPSSGVSFLLRVQKRLDQSMSFPQGSSVFNFGDAPLRHVTAYSGESPQVYFDPTFSLLLSRSHTTSLVQRFFDFAVPVDRFVHRPTIERWLDEFYDTMGTMHDREQSSARTAVLFMVFAVAQEHMVPKPTPAEADMTIRYFMAASQQLSQEQGSIRLESVQARLLQCLWLLSQSRINHCWSLFGTVARFSFAIGLHRNRVAVSLDQVQIECRRRTFWSAYSLDNYLSTALGRPRTFHDDDIDQEFPASIDDDDIQPDKILQRPSRGQSIMSGPVAYSRLSRILSGILHDVYSIRPASTSAKFSFTTKYTADLKAWRSDISRFLDPDMNAVPLVMIFQRQRNVLNLAYWHTMILTHRPHLLSNFARLKNGNSSQRRPRDDAHEQQTKESVRECLDSAMSIVQTVDDMIQAGQLYRAFWFTPYFAFSAAVILYVYTIQTKTSEPEETFRPYYDAADRCQAQISKIAEPGSLTSRYCLILEELRAEATRHISSSNPGNQIARTADHAAAFDASVVDVGTDGRVPGMQLSADGAAGLADFNVSPSDSLADLTGWGQFDSMVISGLSGLDSLLDSERYGLAQQVL
ncbi:hypothetical protein CkaCkLH20_07223 [Colletotrichum karsti]|uniref:Xylanolytic transcriptional activator regulatory domain-containing protein n=1 Tax=Colletotrichum karsti TaxID=1095194 RepID=A0A9P6I2S5_9PEZI|nr:uncharacterized protein CkaCkLH20_07223 [Colletotrichum karsti]KAF9875403.1 hypothetical protein CkaCkLH20_07223 [Colletotrichum karsti]